jgi:predicted RNA-binding Zn-ribbon protein involved in translation (DUF1610 family)
LKISKWLPRYYDVVKVLNEHMGKTLDEFLGSEVAASAEKHIAALHAKTQKVVKDKIAAHRKVFDQKPVKEQGKLHSDAEVATKYLPQNAVSHACPACSGKGILSGTLIKELDPIYKDEQLLVDQVYLATDFKCLSCGLVLSGLEEVATGDIEPQFTATASTSLHDLYQPEFVGKRLLKASCSF